MSTIQMETVHEPKIFIKSSGDKTEEIENKRKVLICLIGLLLALCLLNFMYLAYCYSKDSTTIDENSVNNSAQFLSMLIPIIYYSFGLFVTCRRYQTGLLLFAWIGFAELLLMLAALIIILFNLFVKTDGSDLMALILIGSASFLLCVGVSLIQIATICYAFLLGKLLKQAIHSSTAHI